MKAGTGRERTQVTKVVEETEGAKEEEGKKGRETQRERRLIGKRQTKNMILFSYSEGRRGEAHGNEP